MFYVVYSDEKKTGQTTLAYSILEAARRKLGKGNILAVCMDRGEYGKLLAMEGVRIEEGQSLASIANMAYSGGLGEIKSALPEKDGVYFVGNRKGASFVPEDIAKAFFEQAAREFDFVLADMSGGKNNKLNSSVFNVSDGVINVILQDVEMIRDGDFLTGSEIAVVVNRYADIYPRLPDIQSLCGKTKAFALPWCAKLMDMRNRGELDRYRALETEYNAAVGELCEYLFAKQKAGVDTVSHKAQKGGGMFGFLF